MKKRISFLIGLLVVLFLTGCATNTKDPTFFEEAPLYGIIYDYENRPVKGVVITEDGNIIGESDINGRFYLADMEKGDHTLIFEKEGYQTLKVPVRFLNRTEAMYLKIRSAFNCLSEANRLLSQESYYEASQMIELGLSIDNKNSGLYYLDALLNYKTGKFPASIERLEYLLIDLERKDDVIYDLLLDIAEVNPNSARSVRTIISENPPPFATGTLAERINALMGNSNEQ